MTRQLLAFSRRQMAQPQVLDVNRSISDLAAILRRIIQEDIDLTLNLCPQVPTVFMDPCYLEQIVLNLTVNAREAMPNGGGLPWRTTVAAINKASPAFPDGVYAVITFSDTGHGMTQEVQSRIQSLSSPPRPKAPGWGWRRCTGSCCRRTATCARGERPRRGTTFRITSRRIALGWGRRGWNPVPCRAITSASW